MKNTNYYAVIMAGGVGSRFWPVSTQEFPKQFHDMLGTGQSLIQRTYERINDLVSQQRELVAAKIASAELHKASWQEARAKRKGVERFIEKREANKSIAADKNEQKLLDDLFLAGRSK